MSSSDFANLHVSVGPPVFTISQDKEQYGSYITSGDAVKTVFQIPHNYTSTPPQAPSNVYVAANSSDAMAPFSWSVDAQYITVTYDFPPPSGLNNLAFYYRVS